MKKPKVYLAGPMRGYKHYNFPAFDRYQAFLEKCGYSVFSPAQIDRDHGFDPVKHKVTPKMLRTMILRDVKAVCNSDYLALMPGWTKSRGAKAEKAIADFLSLPIIKLKL